VPPLPAGNGTLFTTTRLARWLERQKLHARSAITTRSSKFIHRCMIAGKVNFLMACSMETFLSFRAVIEHFHDEKASNSRQVLA